MACGARDEIRTRDPDLGKVVLYQLSYSRICESTRCSTGLQIYTEYQFCKNGMRNILLFHHSSVAEPKTVTT
jgi:hypothetical protein